MTDNTQPSTTIGKHCDPFDVNPNDPFDTGITHSNQSNEDTLDDGDGQYSDVDGHLDEDYVPESDCMESDSDDSTKSPLPAVEVTQTIESECVAESDCSEREIVYPLPSVSELLITTGSTQMLVSRRSAPGKLDKYQYCVFCKQGVLKIARHLTRKHKNDPEVAKLLVAKESKSTYNEYLLGIAKLKCKGNFQHNVEVLSAGGSDIVVSKRPSKPRPVSDFLPCIFCYGFFVADELWKHVKNCECRNHGEMYEQRKTLSHSRALLESAMLGGGLSEQDHLKEVRESILARMTRDDVYETVKKDNLILSYGAVMIKKLGKAKGLDISQRMRQLGRLLMTLQKANHHTSLDSYISGKCFDIVIEATEKLCGLSYTREGRRIFKVPSLALRLGHLLVKIGNVKRGLALRKQSDNDCSDAEAFLSLLKSEWTDTVSSCALNTLKRRKDHDVQILPLTEDLVKVRDHIIKEMEKLSRAVLSSHDYVHWRKLSQLTMSRLILFNKRRGGEVARLLLASYKDRPNWKESMNQEILSSLKGLELALIKRLDLIEVPGKKNRKVPILVSMEAKKAMEVLAKTRKDVGIPDENPFFFASRSLGGYLNSWQALRAVVDDASVSNPISISSTRLRKYIATVCQLFDLKEGEMEWLANHMGHELHIHRDFYRLHESTVEMAKVSRLLMAIDSGQARQFTGKNLDEINLDDIPLETDDLEQENGQHSQNLDDIPLETDDLEQDNRQHSHPIPDACESEDDEIIPVKRRRNVQRLDSSSEEEVSSTMPSTKTNKGLKKKWTTLELSTLKSVFGHFLKVKAYPSGKLMQEEIAKHSCLCGRTVAQIRAKLQHLMR